MLELHQDPLPARHRELLERLRGVLNRQLFFVVGCQKSGTTWVQKLLDGHPAARCHCEAGFAAYLFPLLQKVAQAFNQHHRSRPTIQLTKQDLLDLMAVAGTLVLSHGRDGEHPEAIGEKTLEHAMCLPVLDRCFPEARLIHVIRDGRDVCVSGWFHNLREGNPSFRQRFPDMNRNIEYTVRHHWLPYIEKARAFGQQHPQRYLELRYEQLHADPEPEVARMLEFLGLDAGSESVASCLQAGSFQRLAQGRSRGEEDRGSFFRKGIVGDWRNHFDAGNLDTFMRWGGPLLRELGCEA